jgi:predicted NodU family carbamoyl transferase
MNVGAQTSAELAVDQRTPWGQHALGKLPPAAEFMLAACPVRADAARTIPACTHADMSARPQLVSRATTPRYFDVIDEFRRLTGVPAIINTSFNLAGEAIVNDGTDAVDTFLRCDLNTLVLDNLVITKSVQPAGGS